MTTKIFEYALKVFLFIGAVFYIPYNPVTNQVPMDVWGYMVQELFFRYGIVTLFLLSVFKEPMRIFNLKQIGLFGLFVLFISAMYGFDVGLRQQTLNIFFGIVFFKLVYENFDFKRFESYVFWFGWLILVNFVMCVLQFNGIDPITQPINGIKGGVPDQLVGFMRHKVNIGLLSALVTPVIVFFHPVFALAVLPMLWIGRSSSAIGSLVLGFGALAWLKLKRKWFFLVLGVLISLCAAYAVFYDMPGGQFAERLKIWHQSIGVTLKTNTIFGNGIGSFSRAGFTTPQTNEPLLWTWAHNEFVQSFFELGLVGVSIILSFLYSQAKRFEDYKKDHILQILLATNIVVTGIAFFHFPFHLARFAHICIFFMAIYCSRLRDNDLKNELVYDR